MITDGVDNRGVDRGPPTAATLEVEGLSCAAGHRILFRDLGLRIEAGSWTMLVGANGSGKSTLLRALAGLTAPLAGEIRWDGAARRREDADWREQCLYQGHASGWKDGFDARENLAWQLACDGLAATPGHIDAALARAGLGRRATLPFARLSAGQRRRLSLARLSCSHARRLWLLDEPGTALDRNGWQLLADLLDEHLHLGGLALVATHQALPGARAPQTLSLDEPGTCGE